jgi:hypothetical protein
MAGVPCPLLPYYLTFLPLPSFQFVVLLLHAVVEFSSEPADSLLFPRVGPQPNPPEERPPR